ncbi:MAG: aminodeoxyfutalosine deaminase [Verrucomicrobiota bacterium]|jgi:cytosine/adenosine deaminase-related metal-dependent hydrolase
MIIRARMIVPMEGDPIENGAVSVEGNRIVSLGRFDEVKADHGADVRDLGDQILLPGLINGHCHLDYTMLRGKIPPQQSFNDWIGEINTHKKTLQPEDYLSAIAAGFAEAKSFGTTTIVNLEAFPELLPRLDRPQLRTWWCAEMIDIRQPVSLPELSQNLRAWSESHPDLLGGIGLCPHAPFTASAQLYAEAGAIARIRDWLLTTHLAESREEMQAFRDANGSLFEFLQSIGRPMDDCGRETPLSFLLRRHLIDQRWIVAHLNELTESDFDLLAQSEKFHIAHCPRSHTFLGHAPFALRKLRDLGFNICLGTDSLASNSSLSLFSEMRELLRKEPWISSREVLEMATINGARAIGRGDSLGKIRAGFTADMISIPYAPGEMDVCATIVAFEGTVPWIMVDGEVLSPP